MIGKNLTTIWNRTAEGGQGRTHKYSLSGGIARFILPTGVVILAGLMVFSLHAALGSKLARTVDVYRDEGAGGVYSRLRVIRNRWSPPNVQMETDAPDNLGLDSSKLELLGQELVRKNTDAFLVIKDGKLVYEIYGPGRRANDKLGLAAMAKPVLASIALAAAASDGLIALDDPVSKYVPAWEDDPPKSEITIRQLGSHSSGLDDVKFGPAESDPEWKHTYYDNPGLRFPLSLATAPLIMEPGTKFSYSGVGYYVLAYALTSSLRETSNPSIQDYIENRIMKPLDVPGEAWSLSYGKSYEIDGMELYAFGSGARQTARSVARLGELVLNKGEWKGQQVIDPKKMARITSYEGSNPGRAKDSDLPPTGIGWFLNDGGFFKSLPEDAIIGTGRGPNITLVIPSMNVVSVRIGGALTDLPDQSANLSWEELDEFLFAPLIASVK